MTQDQNLALSDNSKTARTLALGGLLGAITGMGFAYLLLKRSEQQGGELSMSTGEGLRLGLLLLGLLRQVSDLAVPDSE
jgi:hypothetical protein